MIVYYLVVDHGDGSSGVHFFRNRLKAFARVDEEDPEFSEVYRINDGVVRNFEIPSGPNTIRFEDAE